MGGFYTGTDLANKTFYGFRLTQETGNLDVDVIKNGDGVVSIPDPTYILAPNQYVNWVWSSSTYQFQWGDDGHLLMVIV